ncbi:MAG TPA: hypothetical protein VK886_22735 [Vicinamibacterales bacterium]|nr:hypothetical protein [Vicinamibacterales bacterium]
MQRSPASRRRSRVPRVACALAGCGLVLLLPGAASAQRLEFSITPSAFVFPAADPDVTPVVMSPTLTIQYRVQQNVHGQWRLTVRADGDLTSGSASIPISNVTWNATPAPPFQNGTMSATVEQLIASGAGNVTPPETGSLTFQLVNSWNYAAGLYTQSFVFTLSAP